MGASERSGTSKVAAGSILFRGRVAAAEGKLYSWGFKRNKTQKASDSGGILQRGRGWVWG